MKRSGIALILTVFMICMVTGYLLTRVLKIPTLASPQNDPQPTQQQNLVLVHLDNFVANTPRLQSIWIIFLNYSNRPTVGFLQLYQAGQPEPSTPVGPITLTPEKHLPADFLQSMSTKFKVRLDGYVLLDDQAMITFANVFPNTPEMVNTTYPSSEHEILARICHRLIHQQTGEGINVPWMDVLTDHFSTDIPFDTFLENWGKLTNPANPPTCEIITRPQ